VPVEEACGECRGTGAAPGTAPLTCPECGGRGVQSRDQGFFALSTPCSRCGGEGRIIEKPCSVCGGNGRVRRNRQVKVRIPAGAKDGMKVRIPGRGSAGRRGGPAGDLYVVTRVEEHPVFRRRGDDFVVEVPVSFVEAVLGAQIEVPRPGGGTVRVKLPAGTQDGKQFKVRGAGAPRTKKNGAENGNLIVRVGLVVPKKLKRREREILEALAEERDEDVRQDLFKKVRS
jgi:molecular chaperone DnaJ